MSDPGQRLTLQVLANELERLMEPARDIVAVNGGLFGIGHLFGLRPAILIPEIVDLLLDFVGAHRTLVVSAYTSDFPKSRVFDLVRSKPFTGALVEELLRRDGVIRTPMPMNSYGCIGPLAKEIAALRCSPSWGESGVMGFLERHDALFVALGMPLQICCPYFHRGEEIERPPYRYHKRFTGDLFRDGIRLGPCEETVLVRPMGVVTDVDYSPLTERLLSTGEMKTSRDPRLRTSATPIRAIISRTVELLGADPYVFVRNRTEVADWVSAGLAGEIGNLTSEQRL